MQKMTLLFKGVPIGIRGIFIVGQFQKEPVFSTHAICQPA